MTILQIIQDIIKRTVDVDFGIPCEVFDYDSEDQTIDCSPIADGADFLNVKLQAEVSSGALYIPKIGSVVIIQQTSSASAYVSMFGELDEIVFMDGDNGGMVKVSELVQKLNDLENDVNSLKQIFAIWVTVPNDGGNALKLASADWYADLLTPTTEDDLADENVKH